MQWLKNDKGSAAEVVRQRIERFGQRRVGQVGMPCGEVCPRYEDLGGDGVTPALDRGLAVVARVFVADATGSTPDVCELVGESEDLAVEGLMRVDEDQGGDVVNEREPTELVLVEGTPSVVLHHGRCDRQPADRLERLQQGLASVRPVAMPGGNLEVERTANPSCRFEWVEGGRRTDELQRLRPESEQVVAIPVLPALGLAEYSDEVSARWQGAVESFAEVRHG